MADTKISALTVATTPLAGTEVLPIVQSGVTKQVSVADLTAGRAVSAASLTLTTALTASNGGTGQSSYAVGDLLYASTTTALSKLADVATGNALISGGVGVAPSWGKIGLTTHVSGTLGVANGGTGLSSATTGDLLYASGTNTWASLADVATGNALISGGVGVAPSWGKVGLTTHISGTLAVGNGGTGLASWTSGGLLYASGTTTLTNGSALTFSGKNLAIGATLPTWYANSVVAQIGTGGVIEARDNYAPAMAIAANAYIDTAGNDVYLTTNYATRFEQSAGVFRWKVAASGTAGTNISFLTAMQLHNSGGVSIGNTTDPGASNLSVTGLVSAARFVPTSSTIPTNGMYLPAANVTGFATNSTYAGRFDATQNFLVGLTAKNGDLGTSTRASIQGDLAATSSNHAGSIGSTGNNGVSSTFDTKININQYTNGATALLLVSRNTSSGTATESAVYIVRFYYDGNNTPTTTYVGGSSNFVTFGKSAGNTFTITDTSGGGVSAAWFMNK